jgi:hypothetical protein
MLLQRSPANRSPVVLSPLHRIPVQAGDQLSIIGMARGNPQGSPRLLLSWYTARRGTSQARLPWAGFVPGTEKLSNKARPEIWTEQVKFKDSSEKLQAEAAKLLVAAKTNNLDNLKAAFGSTAASCKACHDSFRN